MHQRYRLILAFLGLSILTLACVFAVNMRVGRTARMLCDTKEYYRITAICPDTFPDDDLDEFSDQYGPNMGHLFLSDMAFREIFVPLGFNPGTMPPGVTGNWQANSCEVLKDADGKPLDMNKCIEDVVGAEKAAGVMRRGVFLWFCAWLVGATLLTQYIVKVVYKYVRSRNRAASKKHSAL